VIEKTFAEGGQGKLLLAKRKGTEDLVVIKLFKNWKSYAREMEAGANLHHPNIVEVMDSFAVGSEPAIAMKYMDNSVDMFTYMEERKMQPLEEEVANQIMIQIVSAISHCHLHGIAHRDVKLENIIIQRDDMSVKLIDFGLSRKITDTTKLSSHIAGTIPYIAPEVLRKRYNPFQADIWAIGVVFYALLFAVFPFCEVSSLLEFNFLAGRTVSLEAQQLIRGMLEVNPKKRLTLWRIEQYFMFKELNHEPDQTCNFFKEE